MWAQTPNSIKAEGSFLHTLCTHWTSYFSSFTFSFISVNCICKNIYFNIMIYTENVITTL